MDNALTPVSASAIGADSSSDRIIELDSIRGLAALSVVLYHYIVRYHELYTHDETLANAGSFLTTVMPYGRFGVEVFFVLSGFVMLMSVSRAKSARDFLIQRAARLYPAFWAACILTWLIVAWWHLPGREVPAKSLALNLTMVPMWFKPVASWVWYVDGAYWSLKEEFLFYLVIGATLAFGLRRHAIWVVSALAALHLVGADSSLTLAQRLGWNDQLGLYMSFNLRWFSLFAIGMALYEMIATGFRVWRHLPVLLIAFADVIPLYQYAPGIFSKRPGPHDWQHFTAVSFAVLAVGVAVKIRPAFLRMPELRFLGSISFCLYLLHQNIGYVMIMRLKAAGFSSIFAAGMTVMGIIGLASLLTYAVERPVYRVIRGKFVPTATSK